MRTRFPSRDLAKVATVRRSQPRHRPYPRRRTWGVGVVGVVTAVALALAGLGANFVAGAPAAYAASGTYTVTNCAVYGASGNTGTLGDAFATLLASGGTITFQCATTQPSWDIVVPATTVASVLTLQNGVGAPAVTLDGNKAVRPFLVSAGGNLTLTSLTITRGNAGGSGSGGGIYVSAGASLTLNGSTVSASSAGQGGGGIDVAGGTATINNSTVTGSSASWGGGMYAGGSPGAVVSLTDSTFSGNHSSGNGGGIDLGGRGTTLTLVTSTLSGNSGTGGGGLAVEGNTDKAAVTNSTFANNTASYGGGVYVNGTTSGATLSYSTSSGNKASTGGGGLNIGTGGSASLDSTLVAGNTQGGACVRSGPLTDNGYNLADDSTCGFATANHDVVTTTPGLVALGSNGGPTQTVALLASSPAVDAGNTSTCPTTDQRGTARPQGAACDIGAFELVPSGPPPIAAALAIGTPKVIVGTTTFVTSATALTVTGSGGNGGVGSVSYRFYAQGTTPPAFTTVAGTSASFSLSGADGVYGVDYYATDSAGNASTPVGQFATLDDTAPTTSLTIGQPQTVSGGTITVTSATPFTVGATDTGVGVGSIAYRFYAQGTTAPSYTTVSGTTAGFNLTGANGVYQIDYYAADSLGNQAAAQSQVVTLNNVSGSTVTDCSQYGAAGTPGTLGDALATLGGAGTILFQCSTSQSSWDIMVPAAITVTKTLTLQNGTGAPTVILDGGNVRKVISVSTGGNLTVIGLTIAHGNAGSGGSGGGIYVASGATLTLNNSAVSASTAGQGGGGIDIAAGTATLNNSTVTGCSATYGGGIYVGGTKGSVTINNSTISNNSTFNFSAGGALDIGGNTAGAVITGSTITGNSGVWGGAIGVAGNNTNFQMSNSVMSNNVSHNGGSGGAIYVTSNVDTTLITNTTFSGNTAGNGGAVTVQGSKATATVTNSLFVGNSTNDIFGGGAVFVDNTAVFTMINSTVTGNAAKGSGGAFYVGGTTNPVAHISYSTITNNTATVANGGGGVLATGTGLITLDSTLLANNPKGGDCAAASGGTFTDNGYNLADDSSCTFFSSGNHDIVTSTPGIGTLGNYGGPTQSINLLAGSPAIDAGNPATCPAADQRGNARPQGAGCDIGAYEYP